MNRVNNFDIGNKLASMEKKSKKDTKKEIYSPAICEAPDSVRNIARSVALVSPLSNSRLTNSCPRTP